MSDPSRAAAPWDVAQVHAWLQAHSSAVIEGPLRAERFAGGQSNPTFRLVDAAGHSWVMRCKPGPASELLPSAHAIDREYRVMDALADSEVPVPRMVALCTDESVIGRAFYVMAHVEGRILWDQALPELSLEGRAAHYDALNQVLAALHRVDPTAVGLADYGRPGNYFERQIGRWSRQYVASITQPIAAMDELMAWLPANIPPSARDERFSRIVHGDYRLDNVIFHPTEPRILAVLDWELSTLGHPLADFSYHLMSWSIPHGLGRGIGGLDWPALGLPDPDEYSVRYLKRAGLPIDAADLKRDLPFYLAYNLFRMAAILQGIAKRVELGLAASAQAREVAAAAAPLAELALGHARRMG